MNNFLDNIKPDDFKPNKEAQEAKQKALSKELAEYCKLELRLEELRQDKPTEAEVLGFLEDLYDNYKLELKLSPRQLSAYGSELQLLNISSLEQGFRDVLLEKSSVYHNDNLCALLVEKAKAVDFEFKRPILDKLLTKEQEIRNNFNLEYFDFQDKVAETLPLLPNYSKKQLE